MHIASFTEVKLTLQFRSVSNIFSANMILLELEATEHDLKVFLVLRCKLALNSLQFDDVSFALVNGGENFHSYFLAI